MVNSRCTNQLLRKWAPRGIVLAAIMGCAVNVNELSRLGRATVASLTLPGRSQTACREIVWQINLQTKAPDVIEQMLSPCQSQLLEYQVERSFVKDKLDVDDRELTGRGP